MDAASEPLVILAGGVLISAETATREQLIEALLRMRESNSCLRRRLEALLLDIERLADRCRIPEPLREQASATGAIQ
jgi:hypothetical protein